MFRLFHFFFDRDDEASAYPEHLVELAIERAVDSTDPRLRILPGYQRRLRPAVLKAIDQVVALVRDLPPFVDLTRVQFGVNPQLSAFFASAEHIQDMLRDDTSLAELLTDPDAAQGEHLYALLATERRERNSFGIELRGEVLQREVAQVSVTFIGQRLVDPSPTEEVLRKHLRRRAFDHLLSLALRRIADQRETRADLQRQRALVLRKLQTLEAGRWIFAAPEQGPAPALAAVEAELEQIQAELGELGSDAEVLERNLESVIEVLGQADTGLYGAPVTLILDRMGVKRELLEGNAFELPLHELHNAAGRSLVVLPVRIPRAELPAPKDLVTEALRYLG